MCNWVYGGENSSGQGRCFSQIGNNRGNGIMSIYKCMFKRFFDEIFVLLDFDRNGNERRLFNKMYWKLFGRRFIFS